MKKLSIWDILTGVILLIIICFACGVAQIFINPASALNPFRPEATFTMIVLPQVQGIDQNEIFGGQETPAPNLGPSKPKYTPTRTLRPSSTIAQTSTLYLHPTMTPSRTITGTPTKTMAGARCYVMSEQPVDNTEFNAGQEFDKVWTLKNNSGSTWHASDADIKYQSGTKLQTDGDVYDLQFNVADKNTVNITIHMKAPGASGTYQSNWALTEGGKNLCSFFAKIIVK